MHMNKNTKERICHMSSTALLRSIKFNGRLSLRLSICFVLSSFCNRSLLVASVHTGRENPAIEHTANSFTRKMGKVEVLGEFIDRRDVPNTLVYLDTDGHESKRVSLKPEDGSDIRTKDVKVLVAKDSDMAVVSLRRLDSWPTDSYERRKFKSLEVQFFSQSGDKVATRFFEGWSELESLADDGSVAAIVNNGLDPEEIHIQGVPPRDTPPDQDPELLDHFIYILDKNGNSIFTRQIKGPSAPPSEIQISPTGKFLAYCFSGKTYLVNVQSQQDTNVAGTCGWDVEDNGTLFTWKTQGEAGHWEKRDSRNIWMQNKDVVLRKYVIDPGDKVPQATKETKKQD
jgi:hypothetical protein